MAKIETAFSLEINDFVDAIEANELWMEGVLKDKKAFICVGENCYAGITCKNMDTFASDRKRIPHFIMSQHENMHSDSCEVFREFVEKNINRNNTKKEGHKEKVGKEICFHMTRPERHRIIEHILPMGQANNLTEIKKQMRRKQDGSQERKTNYYCLNSLVCSFVNAFRNGTLFEDEVTVEFEKKQFYTYKLGYLFKRIGRQNEITDKDKYRYVYFGKGKVFQKENGDYNIVFSEAFNGSTKKVKCVLNGKLIEDCRFGKANKLNMLNSAIGKEKFIYVFATKNISEKYNTVYLNVKNLDCVAVSDIDVDETDNE